MGALSRDSFSPTVLFVGFLFLLLIFLLFLLLLRFVLLDFLLRRLFWLLLLCVNFCLSCDGFIFRSFSYNFSIILSCLFLPILLLFLLRFLSLFLFSVHLIIRFSLPH